MLHLNIQSIESETKIFQLTHLSNIYKIDIISLNETFLKPNKQLVIPGYNTFRSDRIDRRGGVAVIFVRSNIFAKDAVGLEITVGQNKQISVFSIYSSQSTKLNDKLLDHISSKYKDFVIIGDLNAKNKIWYCKNDISNGMILENYLSKLRILKTRKFQSKQIETLEPT
ncbi:AP-like endonuclease reverse transcriptase [Brachionus plicatilis]|uniref:AP-like endonuclease reverse transcriptase n=1 Tax=Brachionus plicatilis TaxID=10195 RepID=A0A3M7P4J6_BRAPC|nr:AP-like endonuclease reverse transcriptase [Brachionus plicatilis]